MGGAEGRAINVQKIRAGEIPALKENSLWTWAGIYIE